MQNHQNEDRAKFYCQTWHTYRHTQKFQAVAVEHFEETIQETQLRYQESSFNPDREVYSRVADT